MGIKANANKLAIVFHPGMTLAEKLEEMGMGVKEFAVRTSKPEKTIIAVIKGNSSLTTEMAVSFENVTKIPASFWLKKQQMYDEFLVRKNREATLAASVDWMKQFPVTEMAKRGWIAAKKTVEEKVNELFSFFGISTEKAWADYYLNKQLKVAFRISLSGMKDPHAMSAWLRQGDVLAGEMRSNAAFSEKELRQALPRMKEIMANEPKDFLKQLQDVCLSCGVKLICTPCLPKAPIGGATRWINDYPVVQIASRYKRYDIFWFNFFHEIGHILLHGKKEIFLEKAGCFEQDEQKEREADDFAANVVLAKEDERTIVFRNKYNRTAIIAAAKEFGTHPSIIVGRLQHDGIIQYNQDQYLIKKVDFS